MVRGCNSHYGNWHYKESRMGGHLGGDTLIFNYNYGVQNFGGYCSGKNTGFWGGVGLGLGASLGNWLMGGMQQFGGYMGNMGNMMNCWTPFWNCSWGGGGTGSAKVITDEDTSSRSRTGSAKVVTKEEEEEDTSSSSSSNQEEKQYFSEYDTNKDGVVTVKEQKASIAEDLKKVWDSKIARFFKDDISYDSSTETSSITARVKARIQNCLDFIKYAKENNIDIFIDNTDTGVDDRDGELQKYKRSNGEVYTATADPGVKSSVANEDSTCTVTCNNDSTITYNDNTLIIAETMKQGYWKSSLQFEYNEDGSYTYKKTFQDNSYYQVAHGQNDEEIGSYYVTENGNYKANACKGETLDQTLTRLGITDSADIQAVKNANPKAVQKGSFNVMDAFADQGDVYIPKAVIENMQHNGTFDQDKLMGKTV